MIHQIFKRCRWLLPLLGALTFGLMAPQALADRERGHGRGYERGYDRGFDRHHSKHVRHHKHYRHHKHHRYHRHYHHAPRRVKVVEHYYYQEPRHYYHYREHRSPRASISVTLPLGTIVHGLPGGYVSFHLGGDPYYYHSGNYYRPYRRGYEVVSPPPGHRW